MSGEEQDVKISPGWNFVCVCVCVCVCLVSCIFHSQCFLPASHNSDDWIFGGERRCASHFQFALDMYLIICHNTTADSLTPLICILMIFAVMSTIPYYQGYVSGKKKKRVAGIESGSVLRDDTFDVWQIFKPFPPRQNGSLVLSFSLRDKIRGEAMSVRVFYSFVIKLFPCSEESLQTDTGLNCFPALSIFWTCSSASLGLAFFQLIIKGFCNVLQH